MVLSLDYVTIHYNRTGFKNAFFSSNLKYCSNTIVYKPNWNAEKHT